MTEPYYSGRRPGFTLVEMLVVISIIGILAAMAIMFIPQFSTQAREAEGARRLQTWLNTAKQRAVRDQAPRGIRILLAKIDPLSPDPTGKNFRAYQAQYIEGQEDFSYGLISPSYSPIPPSFPPAETVTLHDVDVYNGNPSDDSTWIFRKGDYIEFYGGGQLNRILDISGATPIYDKFGTPVLAYHLRLTSAPTFKINAPPPGPYPLDPPPAPPLQPQTPKKAIYRILRGPKVSTDEILELPDEVVIDFATNIMFGNIINANIDINTGTGHLDLLFSSTGSLMGQDATSSVNLWVRKDTKSGAYPTPLVGPFAPALQQEVFKGAPTILSVFTRTGFVGAFTPEPGNPYSLVR